MTCATCDRVSPNSRGNLHCAVIGRIVPLTGSCSAHPKRRIAIKSTCAWCGKHLKGDPNDPETTHGMCKTCREEQITAARKRMVARCA